MRRRPRDSEGGFIVAEALVSLGLAVLTGALALTLLVWTVRIVERASARMAAATLVERLYEEARVASPAELAVTASGREGRYRWRRLPLGAIDRERPQGAQRLRLEATWTAGGRPDRSAVEAVVVGGAQ